MARSYAPVVPPDPPKLTKPPKLFVLYTLVLAVPFLLILVWGDGPPLSLYVNSLLYLCAIVITFPLDYLALTRFWKKERREEGDRPLVLFTWSSQGLLGLMAGVRLVAWKLKQEHRPAKVAIPVIVILVLLSMALWIAGLLVIVRQDFLEPQEAQRRRPMGP